MSTENKTLWSKLSDAAKAGYEVLKTEMAALKVEMNETTAQVKMGESALQDGTVIKYTGETLAEGSEIIVVAADGSGEIPAPEGDLILADGSTITVSIQDGKSIVSAVKPASAAPEEMKSEEAKQVSERVTKIVEKFSALEKAFEAKFKAQEIQIENLKLKLGKVSAGVIANHDMLVEFGAIPMAEAIEKPADTSTMTKKEKLIQSLTN